jgi:hypothetical protein
MATSMSDSASPKPHGQVRRQLINQTLAVSCVTTTFLLLLDYAPSNFPVTSEDPQSPSALPVVAGVKA